MVVIIIGLHRFQLAHQRVKFLNLNTPLPWCCQCVKELTVWPSLLMHNLVVCMLWKKLMLSWILKKTFLLFARDFFLTLSTVSLVWKVKRIWYPCYFMKSFLFFLSATHNLALCDKVNSFSSSNWTTPPTWSSCSRTLKPRTYIAQSWCQKNQFVCK